MNRDEKKRITIDNFRCETIGPLKFRNYATFGHFCHFGKTGLQSVFFDRNFD